MVARRVLFKGKVQRVGFRYRTLTLSERFQVTGQVRNLPDGSVELIVEGEVAELTSFIERIEEEFSAQIREVSFSEHPEEGFSAFAIAY